MSDFEILSQGNYEEYLPHLIVIPNKKEYSKPIREIIEKKWLSDKKKNSFLFDGIAYSLLSFSQKDNILTFEIQKTGYKCFNGTNLNPEFSYPSYEMANILAVCSLVKTRDQKFLFGKRSNFVAEGKGLWHIPGGNVDKIYEKNTLEKIMIKELQEECNIDKSLISEIKNIGFGRSKTTNKPEIIFLTKIKLSFKDLSNKLKKAKHEFEHTEFKMIDENDLGHFINSRKFVPVGKAAVKLYLEYYV